MSNNIFSRTSDKTILILVLSFFCALMIILNLLTAIKANNTKEKFYNNVYDLQRNIEEKNILANEYRTMVVNNIHSENIKLLKTCLLKNISNKKTETLQNISKNAPLFVFRIAQNSCHVCIERELENLHSIEDYKLTDHLIILAAYDNLRDLKLLIQQNDITYPVYVIDRKLDLPIEELNTPYFFLLDKECRATNIFYPIISDAQLTDTYFKLLKAKF